MQVCTSLQTDNHASTPPVSFYRPDALPASQPTASKHWAVICCNVTDCSRWICFLRCSKIMATMLCRCQKTVHSVGTSEILFYFLQLVVILPIYHKLYTRLLVHNASVNLFSSALSVFCCWYVSSRDFQCLVLYFRIFLFNAASCDTHLVWNQLHMAHIVQGRSNLSLCFIMPRPFNTCLEAICFWVVHPSVCAYLLGEAFSYRLSISSSYFSLHE